MGGQNLPGGQDGQAEWVECREALPDREGGAEPEGADGADPQAAPGFRGFDLSVAGEILRGWQSGIGICNR